MKADSFPACGGLVTGIGVSVQCERQHPHLLQAHRHPAVQLLIALGSAKCDISWREARNRARRESVCGGEILVIPSGLCRARRWL